LAAVIWAIWHTRNGVCFDKKKSEISYWDGLFDLLLSKILGRFTQGGSEGTSDPGCWGGEVDSSLLPQARPSMHTQEEHQLVPFAG
jgi:hypothetical protein